MSRSGTPLREHEPMRFAVQVEVSLRPGIADPEGATIERSLPALGFDEVSEVRVGKAIRFEVEAADEASARQRVEDLCQRFLTNPVIEDATITVREAKPGPERPAAGGGKSGSKAA
jgi:phosphoribosylformylglycinamidine synthase subunit PurS